MHPPASRVCGTVEPHGRAAAANKAVEIENNNPNAHIALGEVQGLSGNVKNVYRADQATLTFGHLRQKEPGDHRI